MLQQTSLETRPCNLEAQQEGTIVEMITRKGVPLFKPGDTCKKGDILVSGELPIQNDSQEIVRYEYVHADADVYVKHKLAYYQEFLRSYETMVPTTHKKKGFFLKIAGFYLGVYPKTDKTWRCAGSEYSLHLTENFCLPFSVGTFVFTEYETVKATYTREEAERTAVSRLHSYEEQLLKQGIKIAENRVSVTVNDTACISKGYLTVLERTGKETAIKEQTPPIRNDRPRPEP